MTKKIESKLAKECVECGIKTRIRLTFKYGLYSNISIPICSNCCDDLTRYLEIRYAAAPERVDDEDN